MAPEVSEAARRALSERIHKLSAGDLLRMLNAVADLEPQFRKSGQQQVLVEMLLVRFALMDRTVEIEDVLRAMGGGGGGGGAGGGSASAPRGAASSGASGRPAPRREAAPPPPSRMPASGMMVETETAPARVDRSPPRQVAADAQAPLAAPGRVLADSAPGEAPKPVPLALHLVVERWDELVKRMRAEGKAVLADALQNGMPSAVSARSGGEVTIQQEAPNPFQAQVIEEKHSEIVAALRQWFTGVTRVTVSTEAPAEAPKRLTDAMIRGERLARLRQQNPLLGAAIDVLDLDVVD